MRIVSLVPDATEIAFALGLGDSLVGVTHECDWPPEAASKPVVVRTAMPSDVAERSAAIDAFVNARAETGEPMYEMDFDLLRELKPDLLLTQSLCDVCAVSQSLVGRAVEALGGRVELVVLSPGTFDEVLGDVVTVGRATGRGAEAERLVAGLRARAAAVEERAWPRPAPRVVVLEWLDPPWACGHWMPEMVAMAGGREMLGVAGAPSRAATWEEVLEAGPEVVVLGPCGFTIERTLRELKVLTDRPGWESLPAVRDGRVYAVDANAFLSRPGPRLVRGLEILAACIHPDRFPACEEGEVVRL